MLKPGKSRPCNSWRCIQAPVEPDSDLRLHPGEPNSLWPFFSGQLILTKTLGSSFGDPNFEPLLSGFVETVSFFLTNCSAADGAPIKHGPGKVGRACLRLLLCAARC